MADVMHPPATLPELLPSPKWEAMKRGARELAETVRHGFVEGWAGLLAPHDWQKDGLR